jgi:hypothetical protein
LLLEELATAVHKQHATQIIDTLEGTNRISTIVYDTEWTDEIIKPIANEIRPSLQTAQDNYPLNIEYDQAKISLPNSILSRERHEHIEHNPQETTELISNHITHQSIINNTEDNFQLEQLREKNSTSILCHPIDNHFQISDEQISSLSDDSFLMRHQQQPNINLNESNILENPLRSTAILTLNYPHHNHHLNPPWQRVFDQQFSEQQQLPEHLQFRTQQSSPRYLPLISSEANERSLKQSDNYVSEFHQTPLLHENVRIHNSDILNLLPSTQINQYKPIYRVRQQRMSSNDDHEYSTISSIHSDHIDRIDSTQPDSQLISTVHVQPPPITIDIEIRVRPTQSETSSLVDMESFLNRFEDSLEPEQHLPLVDQISLSYTTSIRSIPDETHRAIERYEKEHPFFSRSLPGQWIRPIALPHDEQLVEQWTVAKSLETIQQQVELSTNTECEGVVTAAIATDAYFIGERFEEEESNSLNTKTTNDTTEQQNNQIVSAVLVSHCSPTSDYETDSLDKDNDTTSTTASIDVDVIAPTTSVTITLPSYSIETVSAVPVDYLLNTLAIEKKDDNDITKDFLITIGFGQREIITEQEVYLANEDELEQDDHISYLNSNCFDQTEEELLNIFFEPAHFHLPIINEISIYQISFQNEYPTFPPSNLPLPIIHNDELVPSNEYQTIEQEIFSIAQINQQSDNEEDLENISYKYEQPSYIEHYHIQSLHPFSETLYVHIDQPPLILENEAKQQIIDSPTDDQSAASVLPDIIPTAAIQNEVIHANTNRKGRLHMHVYLFDR